MDDLDGMDTFISWYKKPERLFDGPASAPWRRNTWCRVSLHPARVWGSAPCFSILELGKR